jgi:hypothetical protein
VDEMGYKRLYIRTQAWNGTFSTMTFMTDQGGPQKCGTSRAYA